MARRAKVKRRRMPFVQLRRHAPEMYGRTTCCLCGACSPGVLHDHLLVGSPGVPDLQGAMCETCGRVLEQFVARWGPNLSVVVEQAQREVRTR